MALDSGGLASLVLYPELDAADKKLGYVYAMRDFLPVGLKGLLVASFFAAYMSTISTQLNWGTSYVVHDFYRRFVKKEASESHYVFVSRVVTLIVMVASILVTLVIQTISGAWQFLIESGAGLGLVLMLRFYWWRINAWSEISATVTPFLVYAYIKLKTTVVFPDTLFYIVGVTTAVWILVTFLTKPVAEECLIQFYRRVHPGGIGWRKVEKMVPDVPGDSGFAWLFLDWVCGVLLVYGVLFGIGKVIFWRTVSGVLASFVGSYSRCHYLLGSFQARLAGSHESMRDQKIESPPEIFSSGQLERWYPVESSIWALRSETPEEDVVRSLGRTLLDQPRHIEPRLLYDERGSRLFEKISALPEYYLTRTEDAILEKEAKQVIALAEVESLVELGAGFSKKTVHLLSEQVKQRGGGTFVPIDVSLTALIESRDSVKEQFSQLGFHGLCARYEEGISSIEKNLPTLFAFLGSSVGNFDRSDFVRFFRLLSGCMGANDFFLLGVDREKRVETLEKAYNDSEGTTAHFILNSL